MFENFVKITFHHTAQNPTAIVTEIAGTTRDIVKSTVNVNGYPVLIADTAGIRDGNCGDIVEKEGIRRSINEAGNADLILLVINVQDFLANVGSPTTNSLTCDAFSAYCNQYQRRLHVEGFLSHKKCIIVLNKVDLLRGFEIEALKEAVKNQPQFVFMSCKNEEGITELLNRMSEHFLEL